MLAIAVLALALTLLVLAAIALRISRNVGPLDLEDYARRQGCFYIPIAKELASSLSDWSKPVRLRIDMGSHPLLAEIQVQPLGQEIHSAKEET